MNKIKETFQDKCGKTSAIRVALFVYLVPLIFTWTFISISVGQIQPLDNTLVTGLGLLVGGKSIQHFSEQKAIEINPPK